MCSTGQIVFSLMDYSFFFNYHVNLIASTPVPLYCLKRKSNFRSHHLLNCMVSCIKHFTISMIGTDYSTSPWLALHGGWGTRDSLWILSRIPLMYTLGTFLILFEGMNHLFIVEDPKATSRHRTGIKAPSLHNCLYFSMYRVIYGHTHIHS